MKLTTLRFGSHLISVMGTLQHAIEQLNVYAPGFPHGNNNAKSMEQGLQTTETHNDDRYGGYTAFVATPKGMEYQALIRDVQAAHDNVLRFVKEIA